MDFEIKDIPEGYRIKRISREVYEGEIRCRNEAGELKVQEFNFRYKRPQIIFEKISDPFAHTHISLLHCFETGTVFEKSGSGWIWKTKDHGWVICPKGINWPDVPVGTEFML